MSSDQYGTTSELTTDFSVEVAAAKILVYDDSCPLCIAAVARLDRMDLVPRARQRAYQSFEGEAATKLWAAGIRNELLAFDPTTGEIRGGAHGLAWALAESRLGVLMRLMRWRPSAAVIVLLYRLVAYNRRILSLKIRRGKISCFCDPDYHAGYRWTLILVVSCAASVLAISFGSGCLMPGAQQVVLGSPQARALDFVRILFVGWPIALLMTAGIGRARRGDWIGHAAMSALVGALCLIPGAVVSLLSGQPLVGWVQWASLTVAMGFSLRSGLRRKRATDLENGRFAFWVIAITLGPMAVLALLERI